MRRTRVLATLLLAIGAATAVAAQRYRLPEGPQRSGALSARRDFSDGAFTHCKLMYSSVRGEANGIGWAHRLPVRRHQPDDARRRAHQDAGQPSTSDGEPNYWVVPADRRRALPVPVHDGHRRRHGRVLREEATRLREYLLKGGFLWVDDFWGTPAWEQWSSRDAARCCPNIRSSTCPRITRSAHRCSALDRSRR